MSLDNQPFSYLFPNGIRCGGSSSFAVATFSGLVTLAASTTGAAPLNIPPGTTPTSPNNGDVWATTEGVFAQVNGYTTALGTASPGGRRNLLDNGDFLMTFAGGSALSISASSAFAADRWKTCISSSPGVVTAQRVWGGAAPGFQGYHRITVTTADTSIASTDLYYLQHGIEGFANYYGLGWGAAGAKNVTLSFWVRSSLTGTFSGSLRKYVAGPGNRSWPFTYTINAANTWEYKTVTITGDTNSDWATNNDAILFFNLGSGSTYTGTAGQWNSTNCVGATGSVNLISTVNATWDLTGIQLEPGSVATPFEYIDIATNVARCARFYQRHTDPGYRGGVDGGKNPTRMRFTFPYKMRQSPSVSWTGTTNLWDGTAVTTLNTGAFTSAWATPDMHEFDMTAAGAVMTAGRICMLYYNNSSTWDYNAEFA